MAVKRVTILRAKTIDLFNHKGLTDLQRKNSEANLTEIGDGSLVLDSYPRRIVLELTNACNLKCIMCGRDESTFSTRFLDLTYLEKIIPLLTFAEEVTLFGWGEPTIHPKFRDILEFLNGYPVCKYFVTNGTTLHKIKEYLFDFKVNIMAVSLDGATAATNNGIRVNSNFEQIVSSLKDIVRKRKERGVDYPYINFVFTLMKRNLHELPDMVKLAHDIGIEEVKAVYLTTFGENLKEEILWNNVKEVRRVFSVTEGRGRDLGIKLKLPYIQGEDIAGDKFHKDCYVGWRDIFIGSDGYVRPCQSISRKMFHISKYDNLKDAWNSGEFVQFRSAVNDAALMWEECRRCYQSSHANWNRESSFLQIGHEFAPEWEEKRL
jgi:radical SAM protein with 4Fe4S-binding SPASM domain